MRTCGTRGTRTGRWSVALVAMLLLPGAASALPYYVEEWSVEDASTTVFSDDFEDGIFDSDSYLVACGSVEAGDEAGGALALANPDSGFPCNVLAGQRVIMRNGVLGAVTVTATFDAATPPYPEVFGIRIGNADDDDLISLTFGTLFPGTGVFIADETYAGDPNDLVTADGYTPPADTITLRLTLTEDAGVLTPTAEVAADGGAFEEITLFQDGAASLDASEHHFASLVTLVPEPGAVAHAASALGALLAIAAVRRGAARRAG